MRLFLLDIFESGRTKYLANYFVLCRLFFPNDSSPGNNAVVHLPVCISTSRMLDVKLVKIDSTQVDWDRYNSSHHSPSEAPSDTPYEASYAYNQWPKFNSTITKHSLSRVQHVSLSPQHGRLLIMVSEASVHTRAMNRVYAEEISELIAPSLSLLDFGSGGLFLRLDACSPKDGAPGNFPLKTVGNILLRITTSYRARNSI